MKLEHTFEHIEIAGDIEPAKQFQTTLTWNDRADLRLMLKMVSQQNMFSHEERNLALRLIGELDQLPLEF